MLAYHYRQAVSSGMDRQDGLLSEITPPRALGASRPLFLATPNAKKPVSILLLYSKGVIKHLHLGAQSQQEPRVGCRSRHGAGPSVG